MPACHYCVLMTTHTTITKKHNYLSRLFYLGDLLKSKCIFPVSEKAKAQRMHFHESIIVFMTVFFFYFTFILAFDLACTKEDNAWENLAQLLFQ